MDMNDLHSRRTKSLIVLLYAGSVAAVLWPATHESLGWRIAAWDCIVPTVGFLLVLFGSNNNRPARIAALVLLAVASLTVFAFVGAWAFRPLDTDPHSVTTVLVFVYLPIVSAILAGAAYLIARVSVADPLPNKESVGLR